MASAQLGEKAASCASAGIVPARRVENIRASCDNCARSKVRCSKEQPQCQRCIHQGVKCTYSPSQRARRRPLRDSANVPPREQRPSSGRQTPTARDTTVIGDDANHQRHYHHHHHQKAAECVPNFDFDLDGPPTELQYHHPFTTSSLFAADIDSPSKWDGFVAMLDDAAFSPKETTTSSSSQRMKDISPLPPPPPCERHLDLHGAFGDLEQQSPCQLHRGGSRSPRFQPPPHHQCSQLATAIIQKLDVPIVPCTSLAGADLAAATTTAAAAAAAASSSSPAGSSSLSGHGGGHRPGARSFDTILKENRAALDNVLTILQCTCTAKSDLVFLITTVCSRVLAWYQASLERSASSSSSSSSSSRGRASSSSRGCSCRSSGSGAASPSLCSSSADSTSGTSITNASSLCEATSLSPFFEWVSIPSIRIGAYTVDHGMSDRMVAQLIQTELLKVEEVVDLFARTYCYRGGDTVPAYASSHTTAYEESENRLHLALEAYLRNRLRMALQTARVLLS
ncbi:hypothetical protein VTO42DRAFT_3353 [Malbranchea cinnamomea]